MVDKASLSPIHKFRIQQGAGFGWSSSDVITEDLNILVEQSQEYIMETEDDFILTSLRLTGSIVGEGVVKIFYVDSSGGSYLVYTNVKEKKSGNLITGMAVADPVSIGLKPSTEGSPISNSIGENQEISSDIFYNECVDTCFMSSTFNSEASNKLVFQLGEGVSLKINQLSYTTE